MLDLIIRGGLVVTPSQTRILDVGIKQERIAALYEPVSDQPQALRVIDAAGKIVMPGGVEAHAHIAEPMYRGWTRGEEVWLPSPEAATRAAIFGGTTTVVSFAFMDVHTRKVEFDANIAVQDRTRVFRDHSYTDFAFHPVLTGTPSPATIATIADAIADGTASFKVFTTDVTTGQHGIRIDNGSILAVMRTVAKHGGVVMAHAEDDDLVKYTEAELARTGRDQWYNLHRVHSNLSERIAFYAIIQLARAAGTPLYLAHVTGADGVAAIAAAQAQGQPVHGEVLHNYLCFTADDYRKPDGGKYQTYPALKTEANRLALWQGLVRGPIAVVATDEYTTTYQIKTQGKTIASACGGHAGIETRGMIAYTEGVAKGQFSLERFVQVFAANPARILGMYPQKGAILPGSDADLTLWDPAISKTIHLSDLHHQSDYSIWEGWPVQGWPVMTILRGQVMVEAGQLVGAASAGQFVKRKISSAAMAGM